MTRQEQLADIGKMKLSEFNSQFIIPIPHNFYKNGTNIFEKIEENGWEILNRHTTIRDGKEVEVIKQLGAFNIKTYIYENMIPHLHKGDEKEYLNESKSLLLNKKLDRKMKLEKFDFTLTDIDLWIFEEHIGFVTLNVDIDYSEYSVDDMTEFNRLFRNFKFLEVQRVDDIVKLNVHAPRFGERKDFLEELLTLTLIDNKSFLNITATDCSYTNKNEANNYLFPIYNTSANAKLLTGMQTKGVHYSNGDEIEADEKTCVTFQAVNEMSILTEVPFYLASCSSMQGEDRSRISSDDYIYSLVDENAFALWKYSSGITIHDSCAFIGLDRDGGPLVSNVQSSFYFVYILNLYINFQVRYVEHRIIDENFEARDINYWYKKLQKLKNQFITDDIAIKFQENELHQSITRALKSKDMIEEVTANLLETKEITQSNMGIYMTLFGFIFVTILQEPIQKLFTTHLLYSVPIGGVALLSAYFYRAEIRKLFKL